MDHVSSGIRYSLTRMEITDNILIPPTAYVQLS